MENIASRPARREERARSSIYVGLLETSRRLRVEHIMSRDVTTVASTDTVRLAAEIMTNNHLSCLPVVDGGLLRGLFTQKHALREIVEDSHDDDSTSVGQRMQLAVRTVTPETSVLEASRIMDKANVKWLVVLWGAELVGIVTQSDAIRALTSLVEVTEVCTVMSRDIISVDAGATVLEAVRLMIDSNISCAVATHDSKVVGILTERDPLLRVMATRGNPRAILVADVMSFPVVSIAPTDCIFNARRIMDRKHMHRLLVMDGRRLCGIITQTDILRKLKELLPLEEMNAPGRDDPLRSARPYLTPNLC